MNKKQLIATGTVIGIGVVLAVVFPWAAEFLEGAALGVREFWWVILIIVLSGFAVKSLKKKN